MAAGVRQSVGVVVTPVGHLTTGQILSHQGWSTPLDQFLPDGVIERILGYFTGLERPHVVEGAEDGVGAGEMIESQREFVIFNIACSHS